MAIARALLTEPDVLLLDEVPSGQDNQTERMLVRHLNNQKYNNLIVVTQAFDLRGLIGLLYWIKERFPLVRMKNVSGQQYLSKFG